MTVYPSADSADVFAAHKVRETATPTARLTDLSELSWIDQQCFTVLDDLQRIVSEDRLSLSPEEIGAIQAKLIILRVNLNIRHNVNTPHLGQSYCV